jgi:hypothetical protein
MRDERPDLQVSLEALLADPGRTDLGEVKNTPACKLHVRMKDVDPTQQEKCLSPTFYEGQLNYDANKAVLERKHAWLYKVQPATNMVTAPALYWFGTALPVTAGKSPVYTYKQLLAMFDQSQHRELE